MLPPLAPDAGRAATPDTAAFFARVWRDEEPAPPLVLQTVVGTIALALLALHEGMYPATADRRAWEIWQARRPDRAEPGPLDPRTQRARNDAPFPA